MSDNQILVQEFEKSIDQVTKKQLLTRLEKLLQYDGDVTNSLAFKRNFKECQKLYQQLEE